MSAIGVIANGTGTQKAVLSIGLNTIYQMVAQVAPALAAALAIPFLLRHLGPEAFGIVTLFSTALIYFTMLDLGLGRAATRFIAQSLEAGRPDDLRRYFWGSIILLSGTGLIVALACLPAVSSLVTKYLKISPAYSHAASVSFYIICLTIPLVTLTGTLRGFLEASGQFLYISVVTAFSGAGTYLIPALVVAKGGSLVAVAIVFVLVRIAMCVALAIGCFFAKERPSLYPIFDATAVRRMLSFGGWLSVSNVIGTALVYGDRLFVGIWVGVAAVSSYGAPLDIISRMLILITSLCTVLFPLMSRLDSSGSSQFQSVYRGAVAVGLSAMVPAAISCVVLAPTVMKLWLGDRSTRDTVFVAQVFLAGSVVQSIASIAWTALHARGRSDLTAWIHLAELPLYFVGFYLAATRFGVRGAALAWLGRAIVDFVCMVVLLRVQQKSKSSTMPHELIAAIVSIAALLIAIVPLREAAMLAVLICILTWVWTWRMILDRPTRTHLATVFSGRSPRPVC